MEKHTWNSGQIRYYSNYLTCSESNRLTPMVTAPNPGPPCTVYMPSVRSDWVFRSCSARSVLFKARVVGAELASLPGLTLCDWGDVPVTDAVG